MGLQTGKEALIEFLRIKTPELYGSDLYLEMHAQNIAKSEVEAPAAKPISHLD